MRTEAERFNTNHPELCHCLRWKGMFIDAEWDPTVPHGNDRLFWCHKTQICLGPDGKSVDEYECNEARGCYKPL